MQRVLLLELLLMLEQTWTPPSGEEKSNGHVSGIDQAVQLVFEHRRGITAQAAARLCGQGRNQFSRDFAEFMGVSFAKFSLKYRLGGVASQLVQTAQPLKAIAPTWGFTDASHLVRCFKQHYGCTPLDYRRSRRQTAE